MLSRRSERTAAPPDLAAGPAGRARGGHGGTSAGSRTFRRHGAPHEAPRRARSARLFAIVRLDSRRVTARLRYRSPIGAISVEAIDEGVVGVSFVDRGPSHPGPSARARGHLEAAAAALDEYFAGRPPAVPDLRLRGTEFQLAVWNALRTIPWGEVRTYGEIARLLGRAGGARAVGGANHENPIAILVPCHRVVAASGRLGGYSAGLEVKRWLLAHEAAHAPALRGG